MLRLEGSTIFHIAKTIAGITAIIVAIYRSFRMEIFTAFPNSISINRCILVAVSRVVAAKEITRTAINVLANSAGIPKTCISHHRQVQMQLPYWQQHLPMNHNRRPMINHPQNQQKVIYSL